MKTVKINEPLKTFAGKPITDSTKDGDDKTVYVKDILIQYVGQLFDGENKARVLLAYKVAQKMFDCGEETIDLEDAEFKLVVDATEKPKMGHSPMILGAVYQVLEDAEKTGEHKKGE